MTEPNGWLPVPERKRAWQAFKAERISHPVLMDEYWGGPVLTQPAAIKIATDWAKAQDAVCFFDAGDVQANGFQIVEDERPGQTFTETGASYMGFAVSALLATGVASKPFYALALTGDGSFTMNPQILIDGVEHGARGCILLLDNGRMGAITGLQNDQYGAGLRHLEHRPGGLPGLGTRCPRSAGAGWRAHTRNARGRVGTGRETHGLTLIHVPVYFGPDPLGGMGVYGRWNVGNWCEDVQKLRHEIGL